MFKGESPAASAEVDPTEGADAASIWLESVVRYSSAAAAVSPDGSPFSPSIVFGGRSGAAELASESSCGAEGEGSRLRLLLLGATETVEDVESRAAADEVADEVEGSGPLGFALLLIVQRKFVFVTTTSRTYVTTVLASLG